MNEQKCKWEGAVIEFHCIRLSRANLKMANLEQHSQELKTGLEQTKKKLGEMKTELEQYTYRMNCKYS